MAALTLGTSARLSVLPTVERGNFLPTRRCQGTLLPRLARSGCTRSGVRALLRRQDKGLPSTFGSPLVPLSPVAKPPPRLRTVTCNAAESAESPAAEGSSSKPSEALTVGFFFGLWYLLNVFFNILNKKVYNYFPYPWFVSLVHLVVGSVIVLIQWAVKYPEAPALTNDELKPLVPVAFCHALGHVTTNVSFALVAVSFTHTIKALEPFFNAIGSIVFLGQSFSAPVLLSLVPVVFGVSMASMSELSFNWPGFIGAMTSNVAFTFRSIFSKKAMTKKLDAINLYAVLTLISTLFCIPPVFIFEGATLQAGWNAAVAKVGLTEFIKQLLLVGFFYHTYNAVAYLALERVAPLTHAVGNVLKRVFVIGFSILVFGNKINAQTATGTVIAIAGVAAYSLLRAKERADADKKAA